MRTYFTKPRFYPGCRNGFARGDALHLTSALQANVKRMATLDDVFARNAKHGKLQWSCYSEGLNLFIRGLSPAITIAAQDF